MSHKLESTHQPRVMMYSQDGFGLGHMRRTSSLAQQLLATRPDASILTLADSRLGHFFDTTPNHDYIKLPSIVKAGPGRWEAVNLPLPFDEVRLLRQRLIQSAVQAYHPDILLVDHMPHGAMGELLPTLDYLRATGAATKVVLGLRDILDAPAVVQSRWQIEGAYEAIERYYDSVLIYGERGIFDLAQQYRFPLSIAERLHYCGYVCTPATARYAARVRAQHLSGAAAGTKLIVAMAGGGADAYPMMRALLDALPLIHAHQPCVLLIVAGPFMPPALRHDLEACARGLPARVRVSVSDPLSYIDAADLVIAMAGYNTTTEILRSGKRAILIPRSGPSAEQRMRATIFQARGWLDMLDPDDLRADTVANTVITNLAPRQLHAAMRPNLHGLTNAVEHMLEIMPVHAGLSDMPTHVLAGGSLRLQVA